MGLDMYLHRDKTGEELAYWRKANSIHSWFQRLCEKKKRHALENCEMIRVKRRDLIKLRNDCQKVVNRPNLASKIMPTRHGFFFGTYNYDSQYFHDLKTTISHIDEILNDPDIDKHQTFSYHGWW